MILLKGHLSEETAYVVNDYPYGFRLRCKIRYWLEWNKNGVRFCSQTTNPKKEGEFWNKAKKGTYASFMVLLMKENGHITANRISTSWTPNEQFEEWLNLYSETLPDFDQIKERIKKSRIFYQASKYITYEIGEETQSDEDKTRVLKSALNQGVRDFNLSQVIEKD